MSVFSRMAPLWAVAVAVAAGGCDREVLLPEDRGILTITDERDGIVGSDSTNEVDFGLKEAGSVTSLKLLARNEGTVGLVIDKAELLEGDAVPAGEAFALELTPGTRVEAGALRELWVTFTAPEVGEPSQHHARVRVLATDDKQNPIIKEFVLRARVVPLQCDIPASLTFGKVSLEDIGRQSIVISNPMEEPVTAVIGSITSSSGGEGGFTVRSEGEVLGASGSQWSIPAGGTRTLEVAFLPLEVGPYLASLRIHNGSPGCEETQVTLEGTGVSSVLTWAPAMVECGWVPPGNSRKQTLTFTNEGEVPVELTNLRSSNAAEVQVSASTLHVPARGGTAQVEVTCSPTALGPRQTTFTFGTDLRTLPAGQVQVRMWGGGPEIEVEPFPLLDFGRVPLVDGGIGRPAQDASSSRRTLRVRNLGNLPAVPDNHANLRLGTPDENGDPVAPYWRVEPLDANTSADEFTVSVPAAYDNAVGLVARAGVNTLDLTVTLQPLTAGTKRARLTLFSNDADEGELEITLTAEVLEVPSCRYAIEAPAQGLHFGVVTPPEKVDQSLRLVNLGTAPAEVCFVSGLQIDPGSSPLFSIAPEQATNLELQPGESIPLRLRATGSGSDPTGQTALTGAVEFHVSSSDAPRASIPLHAIRGPQCLLFSKEAVDFGTTAPGCGAFTETIRLYNVCSSQVLMQGFAVEGSGFSLEDAPQIGSGGLAFSEIERVYEVTLGFAPPPGGSGFFRGDLRVTGTVDGEGVTWVLPLEADVSASGEHVDTFSLPPQPKVDVLFVLDDSGSGMPPYYAEVVQRYAALMAPAFARNVDFHMGLITTDMTTSYAQGQLQSGPLHPEKVLTPTTANLAPKFEAKWNVGGAGSGHETCLAAVTAALAPPLTNGHNAGFLRDDASLRVLCMTNAPDQSGAPWTLHRDALWRVRGHPRRSDVSFSAIAGFGPTTPGCFYDSGPEDGRYAELVSATFGFREEVCTTDWTKTVNELGEHLFGPRRHYFLGGRRDPQAQVTVEIDGVPVPSQAPGGSVAWTLNGAQNVIEFASGYAPAPGQTLKLHYPTACP